MNRLFSNLVWVLMFLSAPYAAAQIRLNDAEIKSILQERIDISQRGVGLVVGVIDSGGSRVIAHGRTSRGGDQEPDGNTAFEIGSITKVFTSILLADMVERGELVLDDPVTEFLPESVQVPDSAGRPITLRDLATHRSGLPRLPENLAPADWGNPYADYTVEELYRFLNEYDLPRDAGAQFEYSILGVGLLGHVLALRAGMDYEALLIARIAEPLGLADTRIALAADLQSRLAAGHDLGGRAVANWDLPTLAGAGALRSTANDLLDFLAANMGLSESGLAAALVATHVRQDNTDSPGMSIGLGWFILEAAGNQIIWHNGSTGGYRSFAGFDKNRQLGVVVLSNSMNDVTDIGLHLFDGAFPLARLLPLPEVVELDPALLDVYVGEYELIPDFIFTVTKEVDRLFVQATGQGKIEVFPASETRFFSTTVEAQITFVKDENGKVTHLTLHQSGIDQDARKLPAPTAVLERYTAALPEDSNLDQNYPNPFNSNTVIPFVLSEAAEVDLGIYNLSGQRVATLATGWRQAGSYTLRWDGWDNGGRELASGVYLYRLEAGEWVEKRKLLLLR